MPNDLDMESEIAALDHARRAEAAQLQGTIQALRTELEAAHGRR